MEAERRRLAGFPNRLRAWFLQSLPQTRVTTLLILAWLGLTIFDLLFIARFRTNIPAEDEWWDVPVAVGEFPLTLSYLWGAANDHRNALCRLLYYMIVNVTGTSFRAVALVNILLMAAVSAVMLRTLHLRRGRSSIVDLAVPLALLNLGMWEPFLWNAQFHLAVGTTLAILALLLMTRATPLTLGRLIQVSGTGILLVGCGGAGLPYVPMIALWLAGMAVFLRRQGERQLSLWAGVGAVTLVGLVVLYFVPDGTATPRASRGVPFDRLVHVALQFVSVGYGPVAFRWFPGDLVRFPLLGILAVATALTLLALILWQGKRIGFPVVFGHLVMMLAFAGMAVGLASSRGWDSPTPGYAPRYAALSVFGVIWLLTACATLNSAGTRGLTWVLFALTTLAWYPSYQFARNGASEQRMWLMDFAEDVQNQVPVNFIADRFAWTAGGYKDYLEARMLGLQAARLEPYTQLAPARTEDWQPLDFQSSRDAEGHTVLRFPDCREWVALRIHYSTTDKALQYRVLAQWDASGRPTKSKIYQFTPGEGKSLDVWVGHKVEQITLRPSVMMNVERIEILEP